MIQAHPSDSRAERLMREFYLSSAYDPKAARPADTVRAAIEFALSAAPGGEGEPVAWLLKHPTEPTECEIARWSGGEPLTDADRAAGWTSEPLFTASDPVAWRPDRESVARLVQGGDGWAYDGDRIDEESLAAADAILALTAPFSKGGA